MYNIIYIHTHYRFGILTSIIQVLNIKYVILFIHSNTKYIYKSKTILNIKIKIKYYTYSGIMYTKKKKK